ncbi:hypothetical protein D3C73_1633160 [compost metagenome]
MQYKPVVQVRAVIRGILSNQADFLDALGRKLPGFRKNRFHGTAAELAPHDRDAAEGAGIVTAFGDFDIGGIPGSR